MRSSRTNLIVDDIAECLSHFLVEAHLLVRKYKAAAYICTSESEHWEFDVAQPKICCEQWHHFKKGSEMSEVVISESLQKLNSHSESDKMGLMSWFRI